MTEPRTLSREMEEFLPPVVLRGLRSAGDIATQKGLRLFLVGGSVRDLLLKRPLLDLDLVVEGDAFALAPILAEQLGGKVIARSQFGTVRLELRDLRLDLVSARRESYAHPGALPTVQPAALEEDLARRDFTINAMAVALNQEDFGRLIDLFKGADDLAQRRIRVLHPASFADDATRILRAIRYEQRLGFRMDADTEVLVNQEREYLSTIGGDRLRHELERTFQEARPEEALSRACDLGILSRISPGVDWPATTHHALESWRAEGRRTEPLLFVALLAAPLFDEDASKLALRLNMPSRWRRMIQDTIELRTRFSLLGKTEIRPGQVFRLLREREPAAVQAWAILTQNPRVREQLLEYLRRLRFVKPCLNGNDLLDLGVPNGPAVGYLLGELLIARLDGLVQSRDGEEAFVRQHSGIPPVRKT